MKLLFITLLLIMGTGQISAQTPKVNSDAEIDRHHEIGIDVTGFIKRFLNVGNVFYDQGYGYYYYPEPYNPIYQATYRYMMKPGNIRFGVGGAINSEDFDNIIYYGDSTIRKRVNNILDLRLGWEFKTDLSKRWQAFYGLDIRGSYVYSRNDAWNIDIDYVTGRESKTKVLGIAPVLGFRFKISSRFSLTTEASFALNFSETVTKEYYANRNGIVPKKQDFIFPKLNSIKGSFNQPLSIIATFNL